MLNNLNTEVTIGVLVDNRRSLNSGADAKWTSMNADEHADLRSVVEQIPLHGWHRWGDDRRSVSIVADRPLVQVWHLCKLVQCGALVEQVRFILPEDLFYFFCIKCATQQLHDKAFLYTNHKSWSQQKIPGQACLATEGGVNASVLASAYIWVLFLCTCAHFYISKSRLGQRASRRSGAPSSLPHQSHTSDTAGVLSFVVKNIVNTNDHWNVSNICPQKLHTSGRAP